MLSLTNAAAAAPAPAVRLCTSAPPVSRSTRATVLPGPVVTTPWRPRAAIATGAAPRPPSGIVRSGAAPETASSVSVVSPAFRTTRVSCGGGGEGVVAAHAPPNSAAAKAGPGPGHHDPRLRDAAMRSRIIAGLRGRPLRDDLRGALFQGHDLDRRSKTRGRRSLWTNAPRGPAGTRAPSSS